MAAATYTASDQTATPRLNHEGVTVARATFTLAAAGSLSASDVIFLVKVPNQTWILDAYVAGTAGGDAQLFQLGTAADEDGVGINLTFSETAALKRANASTLPFKVSLSDSARPQWTWLRLTRTSGTSTATMSVNVVVMYAADGAV